jgi:bifunctional Delta-12/omega-3 fatty acid desaturase
VSEDASPANINLKQLKEAIPAECFQSSATTSLLYLARDIVYAAALVYAALQIDSIPSPWLQAVAWLAYTFAQGCVGTGLWILAHECGHGAFSPYKGLNDFVGWVVHSFLLVPYFSWQITHARHHRYTGNIARDVVFVPPTETELKEGNHRLSKLLEHAEDTPLVTLARLVQFQLIGWQVYLVSNATAGKKSLPDADNATTSSTTANHFTLTSRLFSSSQRWSVLLTDIGLLLTIGFLYYVSTRVGVKITLLLYLVPYLWVHHWLGKQFTP